MFYKTTKVLFTGIFALGLAACASSVDVVDIKEKSTGRVIDQVVFASSADHAMTPGVKVAGQIRGGKFVPFDTATAGSPVEQLMPAVTAGIGAYGAIEAAKNIKPDVTNVSQSQEQGQHQWAYAEGGDAINLNHIRNTVSQEVYTKFVNCNIGLNIGGKHYRRGGCGGY